MTEKISYLITETCKKNGINYCSINPIYLQMMEDAQRLGEIICELRIIAGDLQEISERHDLKRLTKLMSKDIAEVDKLLHDISNIATLIKCEGVKK